MEEPAPLAIDTPDSEKNLKRKEYIFNSNEIPYKLILSFDKNFITFKLYQLNNIKTFNYCNKYNYEKIIDILEINNNIYNNLDKVHQLIEQTFLNKNITIDLNNNDNNDNINLILNLYIENKIKSCILILYKQKLEVNEKFDIIFKQINILENEKIYLKDEEFFNLQKLINYLESSVNQKFENNKKKFNLLQKIENENEDILNKNKIKILLLKNEIQKLEEKLSEYNKDKNKGNNINNNIDNNSKKNNKKNEVNEIKVNENKINDCLNGEYKIEKLCKGKYNNSLLFKVILIGDSNTGKTWIIESFYSYPSIGFATSGINVEINYIRINDTIIRLAITDTPGIDKFFGISQSQSKNQDLIMFVYSIDSEESFNNIKERIQQIKKICKKKKHFILIGSKADLDDKREVSYDNGQELANKEEMDLFIEVSAKMRFNIDELFFAAAKILYENNKK